MFRKTVIELFETSLPLALKILEVMGYALKLEVFFWIAIMYYRVEYTLQDGVQHTVL